ncbi:hypothetical protein EKN56_07850 [Limnobaculum zhutongyuii]|uniref:Uncharacterized protein n=1 Tax=Limnobaculum zhutongyuii TaxID=2498113 RepID=A0A411WJH0_9GAMM|nr:hypothetical protein [Limnobaculum zhutongyuii]QBH96316.1 hypothetical protein EKN56_07850 [Limnobaculum zhutongyuii]TQS87095.1 hypothetical protein ELQ32_15410 [Limnobaculum zhutongyuii]
MDAIKKPRRVIALILTATIAVIIWLTLFSSRQHQIVLTHQGDNPPSLQRLFQQLEKDKFTTEQRSSSDAFAFYRCETKEDYRFTGSGVRSFYFSRTFPIKAPIGNVYPDFHLYVLSFENAQQASAYAMKINAAKRYYDSNNDKCEFDKAPWKIVTNGPTLYYLDTRAQMLIDFIERYGKLLEKE